MNGGAETTRVDLNKRWCPKQVGKMRLVRKINKLASKLCKQKDKHLQLNGDLSETKIQLFPMRKR